MKQGTEKKAVAERARAARRAAQLRKEAEERVADVGQAESTPKPRKRDTSYAFTAEDISKLRDEQGLSWRQVAVNLDLGSPSAARTAYTALTGRDYRDSAMTGRRAKSEMGSARLSTRKVYAPEWTDESDQDEIIDRLTNARIIIERTVRGMVVAEEEILVGRVQRLTWDGKDERLCVHFTDRQTGGARSVLVTNIKEVR